MPEGQLEVVLDKTLLAPVASVGLLYYKHPSYDPDVTPKKDVILSLADLAENDLTVEGRKQTVFQYFHGFLSALLGDEFEDHDLLGQVTLVRYVDEVAKMISRPKIVMYEGYPTLIVGADDSSQDIEPHRIRLEIDEKGIYVPGAKFQNLSGNVVNRLGISSLELPKGDGTKIKVPIAVFNHKGVVYGIHIITHPDVDFYALKDAWENRDAKALGEIIAPPYGAMANLNSIFNNMIAAGAFPKDGIVIALSSLTKEKVKKKDGAGEFTKASFHVDLSMFPPVNVTAYYDGENSDEIPLCYVNRLSCYGYEDLGQLAYSSAGDTHPPTPSDKWILHVKGKDPKKKSPLHVVYDKGVTSPKLARVMEAQKSAGYFPMPTKSPAISAKVK